jgi:hypothetical protein
MHSNFLLLLAPQNYSLLFGGCFGVRIGRWLVNLV